MSKEAHSEDHSGKALEGASEEEVYIDADEILQEAVDSNQVEDFDDLEVDDEGDEFQMVVEGDEDEDEDGEMEEGEERRADTSLCAFTAHSEPVFAVALHPTLPLAITGSQDDQAYIFNIKTGEKLLHLTDPAHGLAHTDSVIAVSFSADGMYAATGGMDGLVNVSELEYATEDVPAASEDQQQQQSGLSVKIKQTMSLQGPDEVNVRVLSVIYAAAPQVCSGSGSSGIRKEMSSSSVPTIRLCGSSNVRSQPVILSQTLLNLVDLSPFWSVDECLCGTHGPGDVRRVDF